MAFERQLYASGLRGVMQEPSGRPRDQGSSLSLTTMLQSLGVDVQRVLHNAGNAAFTALLGLQLLLAPETKLPSPRLPNAIGAMMRNGKVSPSVPPSIAFMAPPAVAFPHMPVGMLPSVPFPGLGLSPEMYQDVAGNRASYFPVQRTISDFRDGRRSSTPASPSGGLYTHGSSGLSSSLRLPGRQRVNSTNSINELGEKMGSLHVKALTTGPGTPPHSR